MKLFKEPKYTVADAIDMYRENPVDFSVIPFWKVMVDGIKEKYGCFCQWYKAPINDGYHIYCCAEQYMMYQKAVIFDDMEVAEQILKEVNPSKIQKLGRLVKNYDQAVWNEKKYGVVYRATLLKFTQNKDLQQILLDTNEHILCEASPYDRIWGIGMAADNNSVYNPSQWYSDAQNLLGFALMEVRDKIIGK